MEVFLFYLLSSLGKDSANQTALIFARNTMPEAKGLHVFSFAFPQTFEEHLPKRRERYSDKWIEVIRSVLDWVHRALMVSEWS